MTIDLKSALTTFAPTLATMLGGPLAGAAVTALENAVGLQPGAGIDGITKVIETGQLTPELMATVRAADLKHAELISQQGIDLGKLNADQVAADRNAPGKRDPTVRDTLTPRLLAGVVTVGFFGALGFLMLNGKPATGGDALLMMLSTLATAWVSMVAYYYGTTSGAAHSTELLANSTPGKPV